jgi:hypothetical protein
MSAMDDEAAIMSCPSCTTRYHADCWQENGGCAVYGCSMVPPTDGLKPLEIPPAFWGREDKDCPKCGRQIKAMAVRCRHCGADVEARIELKTDYEKRQKQKARAPMLQKAAMVFLIMALLPFVSIVTAVGGPLFYRSNRDEIRRLPGSYDGYYRIGIAVATAQTAVLVVALVAWWVKFVTFER